MTETPPKSTRRANLDAKVSKNWKTPDALQNRKPGMPFSDRLYYWFIMLGGLALTAAGLAVCWLTHMPKIGGWMIGLGIIIFALGSPTQAARNGYRE